MTPTPPTRAKAPTEACGEEAGTGFRQKRCENRKLKQSGRIRHFSPGRKNGAARPGRLFMGADSVMPWRYELIDAQQRSRAFPTTFAAPSLDEVAALAAGDLVKLGVEFPPDGQGRTGERFWVIVSDVDAAGPRLFAGRIDNDLQCTGAHGLSLGDLIGFDPQHVLRVWTADEGP